MTKAPMGLQDLRRRIDAKAKAEPSWRFWGLYVQVCKMETLDDAYRLAKANNGAPGSDGVTFEAIETSGVEAFLQQMRDARVARTSQPRRPRQKAMPKDGGTKVRVLSMPTIRDRVVQGALKRILEPIVEADFQPGSSGYRPKRRAQEAVLRVADASGKDKTRVIDVDLQAYVDTIRPHLLLAKVAQRGSDPDSLHGLKLILKASGKQGVPPGGVVSPWPVTCPSRRSTGCGSEPRRSHAVGRTPTSSRPVLPMLWCCWWRPIHHMTGC
jgi:RNA-directed DNA polymerase